MNDEFLRMMHVSQRIHLERITIQLRHPVLGTIEHDVKDSQLWLDKGTWEFIVRPQPVRRRWVLRLVQAIDAALAWVFGSSVGRP